VRAERFAWRPGLAAELRALVPGGASVAADVEQIVAAVRAGGDAALRDFVARFDG
jgi:histidinol dehydrogenase